VKRLRAIRRAITLERLLPLAIAAGALILIGSEFTDTFRLEAPGEETLGLESASDRHSWAIFILGLCTLAAVTIAVVAGSKPAATATAVFGVAALLVFLLIDLPDAGKVGTFDSPNNPFVQTKAEPEGGFWLLLVGSLVVAVCGIALATLSTEQLRSLRPGSGARRRPSGDEADQDGKRDGKRPVPPWGRRRAAAEEGGDDNGTPEREKPKRRRVRPKA
jgi:hypothetical protein